MKILGRVDQVTKVRGLFVHPGQAEEVTSRYPQIEKYQVVVTRKEHKDEMTFRIELKEEPPQPEMLKDEIKRAIRDVIKIRGDVEFIPRGTLLEGARKIDDQRSWE